MPLSPGTKLGPYGILAVLGAGGMGEVYKAHDTRLDRMVAIKISKTELSERFEQPIQYWALSWRAIGEASGASSCPAHVGPGYRQGTL
jgi:hypothetical protein